MYRIYSDGNLIYAPNVAKDGYVAFSPKLKQALYKADTLTFSIPSVARGYNLIEKLSSTITVYDDDSLIFVGRCLDTKRSFDNQRAYTCEGALGFLRDSIMRPYTYDTTGSGSRRSYVEYLLTNHNGQVNNNRKIVIDSSGFSGALSEAIERENYNSTLDELQDLEETMKEDGGWLGLAYSESNGTITIKLTDKGRNNGSQIIQFGKNLLDLTEYLDAGDVYNILIPIGKDGLDIKSVNSNKDYLESSDGLSLWTDRIWRQTDYSDIESASDLKAQAAADLEKVISESLTLKIRAAELQDARSFRLGWYYRVLSIPHGFDAYYQLTRREIDMTDPSKSVFEFGVEKQALTSMLAR